jgi:hypothetical protein
MRMGPYVPYQASGVKESGWFCKKSQAKFAVGWLGWRCIFFKSYKKKPIGNFFSFSFNAYLVEIRQLNSIKRK